MGRVAHVQTKDIRSGFKQTPDDFLRAGRRTQCADDFGLAHEPIKNPAAQLARFQL
jgi:hypothetical protein